MPRSKTNVQYDLRLPSEVYRYFRLKAAAEVQSFSGMLRGIIMRDVNSRLAGKKRGLPELTIVRAGPKHQVTMPLDVQKFYKGLITTADLEEPPDLSVVLRSIIVQEYQQLTGQVVEPKKRVKKEVKESDTGRWRGLVRATEERPIVKRKRKKRTSKKKE